MPEQFQYSDYMAQPTRSGRLARARLHHAELSDLVATEASGDGRSESTQAIVQRLDRLETYIRELEADEIAVSRPFRIRKSRR